MAAMMAGRAPLASTAHPAVKPRRAFYCAPCRHPSLLVPRATPGNGPSGINVQGHRPTSPKGWEAIVQTLKAANVKLIAPQELVWMQEKGVTIVDVRPASDYDEGHIPSSHSVPYYQPIQGWTPWQVARRVGYALFGVLNGTEVNPNFLADVQALAPTRDQPLVLYCALGGALEAEANVAQRTGKQTRSIIAAYDLVANAGYTNVQVLKGGYNEWCDGGREVEVYEQATA